MKKGSQLKAPANKPTQQFSTSWSQQTWLRSSLGLQDQGGCGELGLCCALAVCRVTMTVAQGQGEVCWVTG